MKKPVQSLRLFENETLEKLSHVHPITPLVFWTPVIAFLIYRSARVHEVAALGFALYAVAGILVWTLAEYLLHRYVFHFIGKSALAQRLHFLIHGNHHDVANDPTRLVMPPMAGVLIAVVLYTPLWAIAGSAIAEPLFAFFLVGYLAYDYTHYAVHHFIPRSKWGRLVKQHHMLHHYADAVGYWGVSSPLWDHVFGTMGKAKPASRAKRQEAAMGASLG